MSSRNPQRRSYGYTDRPESKKKRHYGDEPKQKKRPLPKKRTVEESNLQWLMVPFQLLFRFVKGFFRILGYMWSRRPWKNKKSSPELKKKIIRFTLIGAVFCAVLLTIYVAIISRDLPDPNRLTDRQIAQSTKIYDKTGEHLLFEIFADQKRTLVELEDIPDYLVEGVIATEDTKFYEHHGIRPLSILRALFVGVFTNKRIAGTSTLTQQLVKNAILTNERRIERKIKEAILSVRLEQKYTKDQILKIYFNEIPYGSTNYGVEAAAQSYFGKSVSDVTLAEAAVLAGIPKQPTTYLNNLELLEQRRNFVLKRMADEGYISEEEKVAAQAEPLELKQRFDNIKAPHFVLYVKELLVDMYDEATVDTGGLKVITSLDYDMQEAAEEIIAEKGTELLEAAGGNNMALTAIDPKTGHVLAMVGSKDYFDDDISGQFNVATLGKRQPGSSFKPIIYAAAFEKGYTPETVLFDTLTNFSHGRPYQPLNYDLLDRGPVTIRQALQGSLNIPAVKTLYLVGEKAGVDFAERLGYSTLGSGDFGLSLVLGGGEVKLLEHVASYATFANHGVRHEPVSILRVEDPSGDTMFEWEQEKGERVVEPEIAALLSNVLSDDPARAYLFGAGGVLTLPGRPVAAKTGTTNLYVDAWTVGYTPSLAVGVWAGNTNNSPMNRGYGGSRVAAPVWNAFMQEALSAQGVESFPTPPANDAKKPALRGSEGGNITLLVDKVTGKLATSSTPEKYIVERTYLQPHSILHYVQKDDPRGDAPEDPTEDPQYEKWEQGIQDWITRMQEENPDWEVSFEEPPTEFDDLHSLELIPTLQILYPAPSSTLDDHHIETDIRVSAPRGVAKVTYRIDGVFVQSVTDHPFNMSADVNFLEPGPHELSVTVEDDVGNQLEEIVPFFLDALSVPPSVSWSNAPTSISQSQFPATLVLNPFKLGQIGTVRVFAESQGGNKELLYTDDLSNLFNNQIFVPVDGLSPGNWTLTTEIITTLGAKYAGESHTFSVTNE